MQQEQHHSQHQKQGAVPTLHVIHQYAAARAVCDNNIRRREAPPRGNALDHPMGQAVEQVERPTTRATRRTAVTATVFVDGGSGSDSQGRLGDPAQPFATIRGAIAAIQGASPLALLADRPVVTSSLLPHQEGSTAPAINRGLAAAQWTVRIMPGVYSETAITLPSGVGLVGSGAQATIVEAAITIRGASRVTDLTLRSATLPALDVAFAPASSGALATIGNVWVEANCGPSAISQLPPPPDACLAVVRIAQQQQQHETRSASGTQPGHVVIERTSIVANIETPADAPLETQVRVRTVDVYGARATLRNVDMALTVPSMVGADGLSADSGASIAMDGGSVSVTVHGAAPAFALVALAASRYGSIYQTGPTIVHIAQGLSVPKRQQDPVSFEDKQEEEQREGEEATPKQGTIYFARADVGGSVWVSGAIVDLATVPAGCALLADACAATACVTLVDVRMRFGCVLPVRGNVTYSVRSQEGSTVTSGGVYTNVRHLAADSDDTADPPRAFLADDDYTVLFDGPEPPTLVLDDPVVVGGQTLYKGKIVVVKNLASAAHAIVEGSISDTGGMPLVLKPRDAVTLQNDGIAWHIIARS